MSALTLKLPVTRTDHVKGNLNAPVVMVEYADFQCPFCAAASQELNSILENFKPDVCLVFRHFPLTTEHRFAVLAAMAAEAAALQGKFWEMHDALFINQQDLSERAILFLARELKLNMEQFERDIGSEESREKVQTHFSSGLSSGVGGTPTLFFNGIRYDGDTSFENLSITIREILEEERDFL